MRPLTRGGLVAGLVIWILHVTPSSAQTAREGTVLDAAAAYVATLTDRLPGIVIEEHYQQRADSRLGKGGVTSRSLVSDLVIMADDVWGWVEFRDVIEVDGGPVAGRDDRVVELFARPRASARQQAEAIAREGARHNLGLDGLQFERTLNQPLAALRFLQGDLERRARFQVERTTVVSGRAAAVVAFREQAQPRLIGTPDGAAASGRFWIEDATGRILESETQLSSRRGNTTVSGVLRVQFAPNSDLGLWLPGSMEEDYVLTDSRGSRIATVSGRAAYGNARRFGINVEERVAAP